MNAQNAFLKLFEEPPANVEFFIITNDASKLLPTIRSRALTLRLDKLTPAQMAEVLDAHNIPDSPKRARAISLADGSVGEAMRIFTEDDDTVRVRRICDGAIDILLVPGGDKLGFISYLQKNVKKTDELCRVMALMQRALRDVMACRLGLDTPQTYFGSAEQAEKYADRISDRAVLSCQDAISELLSVSDTPLNPQLTITTTASRLWDAHLI